MSRKEADIQITDEGRDKGKTFHITEMSAFAAEEWALKVLLAMDKDLEVPEYDEAAGGMAALATSFARLGIRALLGMKFADAKPLLDEMMACVEIRMRPDFKRPLMPLSEDIEEVATLLKLRSEVFRLHTGFSLPGSSSTQT